jgi:predicted LPLAT superfamily acyltransferase
MYHYFRRRHGFGPVKSFFYVWYNHLVFGAVIMDRFACYAGKKFTVDVPDMKVYEDLCSAPEGFLQVSSHIGNDEMSGYVLKASKRINALAFGGEGSAISQNRARQLESNNIRLVPIAEDLSHLVILNNALADGEIVNIHCDRIFGSNKSIRCKVMGADADLPLGPFLLGAMREVPAIAVFTMKTGIRKYKALLFRLDEDLENTGRKERAEAMARRYAACIDKVLKEYPEQWFNYYEFWND